MGTASQVLKVNAGGTAVEWGTLAGSGDVTAASAFGTDNVLIRSDGTGKGVQLTGISVSDTTYDITGAGSIAFGADPGDAGPVRLSNDTCINWEIAATGTDKCLKVNASDQLDFNGTLNLTGAATGSVVINGATSGSLTITGADAMAQAITITGAAQTSGATVLTIPDRAGSNGTFAFTTGSNVATATALAANGANCAAGQYPLGVDASGAAEGCTVSGTVTNTGGNLTENAVVLGAGTVDSKVVAGITTNGAAQLVLGVNATTLGSVKMFGNTSGDVTISPAAVAGTTTALTLPATSDTLVGKATTDTLTNKTIDCTTAGNVCTTYKYMQLDLVGVAGGTAGHVWDDDPLSTTCTAASTAGTNQTRAFCTFLNEDGEYGKQLKLSLPTGYVAGTLQFRVSWKTTGTGNFRPRLQTLCYASDAASDTAYSNSTYITAAAGTSARFNQTAWTTATDTGCDPEETMAIRFSRNRTEGSDTLDNTADVEFVGVRYAVAQ
jgi:hypothetical protein